MNNQIFVKIEEYNEVLKIVDVIKEKITKVEEVVGKISELKKEEDKELETWSQNIGTVKTKIGEIERELSDTKKA